MSENTEQEVIEYASADDLFEMDDPTSATADVMLPRGKRVKVRGMTRYELMLTRKGTEDAAEIERRMISMCLIEPRMTGAQVDRWQKSTGPMVMAPVTEAIRRLSGLGDDADKSDVQENG